MQNFNKAIELLSKGQTGSVKRNALSVYAVTKNALVIRYFRNANYLSDTFKEQVLVAKVNGQFVGNSNAIDLGDANEDGRPRFNRATVLPEQQRLSELYPMIPFAVLKEAGLSLKDFVEIDKGKEETVLVNETLVTKDVNDERLKGCKIISDEEQRTFNGVQYSYLLQRPRHFTGARLFKIGETHFLMDIDRGEIEHGILNPFLVTLPRACTTIVDAYLSLKPREVIKAEMSGLKVKRQGEWFLIPTDLDLKPDTDENFRGKIRPKQGILQAGRNRPNRTEQICIQGDKSYVRGVVSHSGREHKDLNLTVWHLAIPNTAQTSWQISGDID